MSEFSITEFLTAFQLRRAVCQALFAQASQQAELIAADEYGSLMEVLELKQNLLNHLGRLSTEQAPLRTAWLKDRDRLPAADRARCDSLLAETESLLAKLLEAEQSSTKLLTARRDATQSSLASLSVGVQAQHAYQTAERAVVSRFDLNT